MTCLTFESVTGSFSMLEKEKWGKHGSLLAYKYFPVQPCFVVSWELS